MAGTREGAIKRHASGKAVRTIRERYGNDFFCRIGKMGGSKSWASDGVIKGVKKKRSKDEPLIRRMGRRRD